MGLSASSLSIELESDHGKNEDQPLPAGSRLRGTVVVEIHRDTRLPPPLSHEQARETPALLKMRMYGKEKVCMDRMKAKVNLDKKQKGRSSSSWQRPPKSAERQIIDHTVRWAKFPNVEGFDKTDDDIVLAGVYVFPFAIDLPTILPSSTYYPLEAVQSITKRGCRIQYKMDAQLIYGSKTAARKSSYLWLSAASSGTALARRQPTPCMVEPISHEVSGMLSKGNIFFGAAVDDCAVRKGGDIILRVSCRNDSPATIQRVQVSLYEKITWGTAATNQVDPKTGVCIQSATLQQEAVVPLFTLKDATLPSLGKEGKGLFTSAYLSIIGVEERRMFQREIHHDLVTGNNIIKIQVPEESRVSYTGQLVKIEHSIQIQFFTSSFTKNLQLIIPVNVLPSDTAIPSDSLPQQQPYCKSCAKPIPAPTPIVPVLPSRNTAKPKITATTGLDNNPSPRVSSSVATKAKGDQDLRSDSSGQTSGEESSIPIPVADPTLAATPITSDVLVLGGDAMLLKGRRYPPALAPSAPPSYLDDAAAAAAAAPRPAPIAQVSVAALQREMRSAINGHTVIANKIDHPSWTDFFQSLSADDLGTIIASVNPPVDQPRVAVLLAPLMNNGRGVSSAQIAAALRSCNGQHRAAMAQRLLPHCKDSDFTAIRAELNGWEQTVAYNAFGEAEKRLNQKKSFLGGGGTKNQRVAVAY